MRPIRQLRAWAYAIALFAAMPGAQAARLSDVAMHYNSRISDAGNVGFASVTLSIVPEATPKLLSYLGDHVRYDMTVGQFFDHEDDRSKHIWLIYAGPTWLFEPAFLWTGGFIDFGTAASYLGDSDVGERNQGGHFQFTSHVTLGHQFGAARHWRLGLRLQHTSNADLHPENNPGLDVALIELAYHFQP